jgi:ABC-2 type transport system ATP-binding protein
MSTPAPVILVRGLRKSYGALEAVAGVDLTVRQGEVFALLGPNGAGKTTTVEILEGHRSRSAGEVSVLGYDPARRERRFQERIGIVLQTAGVDPYLTVEEAVSAFRGYYPHPLPLENVLRVTELTEHRRMAVRRLSGGLQRRLDVAIGLAGDPELLFLDEPTTGFDPSARRNAWEMVRGLKALGKTVLLTTHYMDEAQSLADRVAIMARGKVVAEGTPAALTHLGNATSIRFGLPPGMQPPAAAGAAVRQTPALTDGCGMDPGFWEIETQEPTRALHELTAWAIAEKVDLQDLTATRPSLEETYLRLVGEAAKEAPAPDPVKAGRRHR